MRQEDNKCCNLFLSYASEDADRARRLTADLRRPGIDVWMDDELKLAGLWNKEIESRIPACDPFVLLLSRATQESKPERFFRREWGLARGGSPISSGAF
jgi:hypothetical protein